MPETLSTDLRLRVVGIIAASAKKAFWQASKTSLNLLGKGWRDANPSYVRNRRD
jgi:hypothetical protein